MNERELCATCNKELNPRYPEKPLPAVVNPTKLRYIKPDRSGFLSLNELYSAFDFPQNYRFFGTLTSKGQQLANAVPVSLAEKFALSLKEVIN